MKLKGVSYFYLLLISLFFHISSISLAQSTSDSLELSFKNGAIKQTISKLKNTQLLQLLKNEGNIFWAGFYYQYSNQPDSAYFYYNQYLTENKSNPFLIQFAKKGLEETKKILKNIASNTYIESVRTTKNQEPLYSIIESKRKDSSFYILNNRLDSVKFLSNKYKLIKSYWLLLPKGVSIISLATVSIDGKTIFFNAKSKGKKIIAYGYISRMDVIAVYPLPGITSNYDQQGFAVSPDKKTLYFSESNSKGNFDLFYVKLTDNNIWTTPIALPKVVNTEADESFPILSKDGKSLFFSSNRSDGFGGYDIYRTEFDSSTNNWKEPILLDNPINSAWDEMMPILDKRKNVTHFLSNRNLSSPNFNVYTAKKSQKVLIKVKVYTSDSSAGISDLNIRLSPSSNIKLSEFNYLKSNSNIYFDSVFIGRHYDMEVLDSHDTVAMSKIDCTYDSDTSHFLYLDASTIKHAQLFSNNEILPFYARYGLTYSENSVENNSVFKRLMRLMKEHKFYHLKIVLAKEKGTNNSKKRIDNLKNQISKNGIDPSRIEIQNSDITHSTHQYIESHLFIK